MIRTLFVLLTLHMAASVAMAQTPAALADEEGGALTMVIALGLIIATGLPAVINPKRTHMT